MDRHLRGKIDEKIQDTIQSGGQIRAAAERISPGATDEFVRGMAAGRLYNSFYYQCRRINKRDPTTGEIDEFLEITGRRWRAIADACGSL